MSYTPEQAAEMERDTTEVRLRNGDLYLVVTASEHPEEDPRFYYDADWIEWAHGQGYSRLAWIGGSDRLLGIWSADWASPALAASAP